MRTTDEVPTVTEMQAIVQDRYGDADVLRQARIARPTIKTTEVLVRVHAAGVDRGTAHLLTGEPYLVRLMIGLRAPKNPVPGLDVAGEVVAVGRDVTRFQPGDAVFGTSGGSFAEFATAKESKLALKPSNLTFEQAAVVPVSGLTALQGLVTHGHVQAGDKVLILGASGGVGTFAVQIAKAYGAEVTGVCSAPKVDMVRSTGADHVLDYSTQHFADGGERYDLILDIGGNSTLTHLRSALTPKGTLVIVGGEGGGKWFGGLDRQLRGLALSPFVSQRLMTFVSSENHVDLEALTELIEAGKVTPVIGGTYPLSEAPNALRHLMDGQARGKLVIKI